MFPTGPGKCYHMLSRYHSAKRRGADAGEAQYLQIGACRMPQSHERGTTKEHDIQVLMPTGRLKR